MIEVGGLTGCTVAAPATPVPGEYADVLDRRGCWYRRSSPSVFVVYVLAAQAQPLRPRAQIMGRQRIDAQPLAGMSARRRGRHGYGDLMLSRRYGGGSRAGDAVVGADYDASADFCHRVFV